MFVYLLFFYLAATVASQWLDFLHQDLSERLSGAYLNKNVAERLLG